MAVTRNYNDYVPGGAEFGAEVVINGAGNLLTCAAIDTRRDEAYLFEDRGAGYMGDGFDYTTRFVITSWGAAAIIYPFVASQTPGTTTYLNVTVQTDHLEARVIRASNRFGILWRGGASVLTDTGSQVNPILGNVYDFDTYRTGNVFYCDVIDVDGGHGTPGAVVEPLQITMPSTTDYRYVAGMTTVDDGFAGGEANYTHGPQIDNTATAASVTNPLKSAIFGERGVLA